MIIDAARDAAVISTISELEIESHCLFKGMSAEIMSDFAPYILKFESTQQIESLLLLTFGQSWGYFVEYEGTVQMCADHFRSLAIVELPDGSKVSFRCYDPRVMIAFMPICSFQQRGLIFGRHIKRLIIENPYANSIHTYRLAGSAFQSETAAIPEREDAFAC